MCFTDIKMLIPFIYHKNLYYVERFQIKCLILFKRPNMNGHLNGQQQGVFKSAPAVGI
jgi:hypothetical protein